MKFLISILVLALVSIINSLTVQNNTIIDTSKNTSSHEGKIVFTNVPEGSHVFLCYQDKKNINKTDF